jgi:uncharacterized protein YbaR (Trm112 family)
MQADPPAENLNALQQWADKLACPACSGALRVTEATVTCINCAHIYPIVDGIPVLIAERAEKSDDENDPSPA